MVGVAGADPVRRDGAIAGGGQRGNEIAIEESPSWVTGKQQHRAGVSVAFVDVGHPAAVHYHRALLPWEERRQPIRLGFQHSDPAAMGLESAATSRSIGR